MIPKLKVVRPLMSTYSSYCYWNLLPNLQLKVYLEWNLCRINLDQIRITGFQKLVLAVEIKEKNLPSQYLLSPIGFLFSSFGSSSSVSCLYGTEDQMNI